MTWFDGHARARIRRRMPAVVDHDRVLIVLLQGVAGLTGAITLFIVVFLIWEALPVLRTAGLHRFVTDAAWYPTQQHYGLLPMVAGTLLIVLGAVLLGSLLGIAAAMCCRYYAPPRIGHLCRALLEVLAGIPSVVYGFWGLTVLVPYIARVRPPGPSLLAGVLVLSFMILPTIALVADSHFAQVPQHYVNGAVALGLGRWATLRGVILPAVRPGLWSGVLLQTGRALGETMAVLMVCGNVVQVPHSLFDPVRTLTANIVLEMAYAMGEHRAALFVSGLFLMACSGLCVGVAYRWGRQEHDV